MLDLPFVDSDGLRRLPPLARLRELRNVRELVGCLEREAVGDARKRGVGWRVIGDAAGVTGASAHRKWRGLG